MCGVDVQDVSMHNVGGDLERKLREKTAREKSEKLMIGKIRRRERQGGGREEGKKKRKKRRRRENDEGRRRNGEGSAKDAAKKVEPTGATNLVGSYCNSPLRRRTNRRRRDDDDVAIRRQERVLLRRDENAVLRS